MIHNLRKEIEGIPVSIQEDALVDAVMDLLEVDEEGLLEIEDDQIAEAVEILFRWGLFEGKDKPGVVGRAVQAVKAAKKKFLRPWKQPDPRPYTAATTRELIARLPHRREKPMSQFVGKPGQYVSKEAVKRGGRRAPKGERPKAERPSTLARGRVIQKRREAGTVGVSRHKMRGAG